MKSLTPRASGKAAAGTSSRQADGILDAAERLAQTRGFNGFSYADIASELGVTKASLHYHFATKEALELALIARYAGKFHASLAAITASAADPVEQLRQYMALYDGIADDDRVSLCGMLAAEYTTLPESMQEQLGAFFAFKERWLTRVMDAGRRGGHLCFQETCGERARAFLGALEGAMLVSRAYGDVRRFQATAKLALEDLLAASPPAKSRRRPRAH